MEDDFNRMHCHSKELNDSLLEISSTDLQLREILLERENFMEKHLAMEKMFFLNAEICSVGERRTLMN